MQPHTGLTSLDLLSRIRHLETAVLSQPDDARKQLMSLLSEARGAQDYAGEAYVLCLLSVAAFFQGNYPDTMLFAEYSLRISQQHQLRALESRCLNALGLASARTGRLDEALEYYRQSLMVAQEIGDQAAHARALINMASIYSGIEDHALALELYSEGAGLAEQSGAAHYKVDSLRGVIETLRLMDRHEEAAARLPEALNLAEKMGFKSIMWQLRYSQAMLHLDVRELGQALAAAQTGLSIAQDVGDYEGLAVMRTLLGQCYLNLADYDRAYTELSKGEHLAQAIGTLDTVSKAKRHLAKLFEIQGDLPMALEYLKSHMEEEEALYASSKRKRAQATLSEIRSEIQRREQKTKEQDRQALAATQAVLEQTRDKLQYQAAHDPLTGASNRTTFWWLAQNRLSEMSRQRAPFLGLILADIDDLRSVNDMHGFEAGDALLREVKARIQKVTQEQDFIGRMNGDEFMVLVSSLSNAEQLEGLVRRLAEALQEPVQYAGKWISAAVALGYVIAPEDGADIATLHQNAELALRQAKQKSGLWAVRFTQELSVEEQTRRRLKADLKNAIATEQFSLHYQGQYHMSSRTLAGFECLVRWQHPQLGLISPQLFIPLAEESGSIVELGEWILREACRQARAWNLAELGLSISVNVSPLEFSQADFVARVQAALNDFGLSGRGLTLEVTEGMVHRDIEGGVTVSHQLRCLGVQVAMDDFGTGYSSLNVLKEFPLEELKIDRAFLKDLHSNHPDYTRTRHLMGTIINLAHILELQVVAEGVETEEQCEILQELGCDKVQGYWLAKPAPAHEVEALLRGGPPHPKADRAS